MENNVCGSAKFMESERCGSEYMTSPINSLSNFSSPQNHAKLSLASDFLKSKNTDDCFEESPIKSESRVMSRSIRGDTDREIYNEK